LAKPWAERLAQTVRRLRDWLADPGHWAALRLPDERRTIGPAQ
jgi:hypothetical protein